MSLRDPSLRMWIGGRQFWTLRVRFLSDSDELAKGPGSQESGHFEELMMIGSHDSKSLVWKGVVENDRNLLVKPAALLKPQRQVWEYCWEYC